MEILEAFDLTGTLRGAAELAGCDQETPTTSAGGNGQADGGGGQTGRLRPICEVNDGRRTVKRSVGFMPAMPRVGALAEALSRPCIRHWPHFASSGSHGWTAPLTIPQSTPSSPSA